MEVIVRFDMRAPAFGTPAPELYETALEMARFADEHRADTVMLTEHHGSEDGYLPAPFVLAGAIAAVTKRVRIRIASVILPLHHPVEVAEQALVLDQISRGRAELVAALGYVPAEFGMYGRAFPERAALMDQALPVLSSALRGHPVVLEDGTSVPVTPRSVQQPRPRLVVAGGVRAAARRAARHGDSFYPLRPDPALVAEYRDECGRVGVQPGEVIDTTGPMVVYIGEDVEGAWNKAGPHLLHEMNAYGAWAAADGSMDGPYSAQKSLDAVRKSRMYAVATPDECHRIIAASQDRGRALVLHPLVGGLDPDFAWEGFRSFFTEVLPHVTRSGR